MKIRERIENYGANTVSNRELLSLITGISLENVPPQTFKDIKNSVEMLEITDLQKIKLEALFELSMRISTQKVEKIKISSPDDAAVIMMEEMRYLQKEHFKVMHLDTKNNVKKVVTVSVGSLNSSIVHPRETFQEAIMSGASSVILVHNHPSGESEPSHEDIVLTNRLDECGKLLGIKVLDHIIIGDGVYFSFKEEGLI